MCPGGQLTSRTRVNGSKAACAADTGAANCATSGADVLREVLKVAALSAALTVARPGTALPNRTTRDRATNRLTGD